MYIGFAPISVDRGSVERIDGETFSSIEQVVNKLGIESLPYMTLGDFTDDLNSENYPKEEWVFMFFLEEEVVEANSSETLRLINEINMYGDRIMKFEDDDIDSVEFAKLRTEIALLRSSLHESKGRIKLSDFYKYDTLCKNLFNVLNALQNDSLAYWRAIKNEYRERYGEDVFLEVVQKVRKK